MADTGSYSAIRRVDAATGLISTPFSGLYGVYCIWGNSAGTLFASLQVTNQRNTPVSPQLAEQVRFPVFIVALGNYVVLFAV